MKKLLIVVDMQNDFITGALGSGRAEKILPRVKEKIEQYKENGDEIVFTRDTHNEDYLETQEGRNLPVVHCIRGTEGQEIASGLDTDGRVVIDKPSFGSLELADQISEGEYGEIEICGLCTDICVVSNALILKARMPETMITVDAGCCAGVSEESHEAALLTMRMCHVNIVQ